MKKILGIVLMMSLWLAASYTSNAQIALTAMKSATGYARDTVTTTTTKYMIFPTRITGRNQVTVVGEAIEISGTTSGTIRLEASCDSVIWYPYYLGTSDVEQDSTSSNLRLTLTDITTRQTIRWMIPVFGDQWIRIAGVGGGSTNWSFAGKLQARKLP